MTKYWFATMNRAVAFSKPALKARKKRSNRLVCSPGGFSNMAASAGLRVRAFTDEIATEMAMVMANCW